MNADKGAVQCQAQSKGRNLRVPCVTVHMQKQLLAEAEATLPREQKDALVG